MKESLIEIRQDIPGFDRFIGSWVCQDDLNLVIDVGPANTVSWLIDSLVAMDLDRVDYILITHIHLDHAGGLAELLVHYPMARVICHEKALKNLVDPSKLWAGSHKALGALAEAYGPPKPVNRERLIPHTESNLKDVMVIETPGHAAHHLSFVYKDRLFVGEAGGNYFSIEGSEYLRLATPPRFFLDVSLRSVERLIALENLPIYYPHFGKAKSSHAMLNMSRDQIMRWKDLIHGEMGLGDSDLVQRCVAKLLEKDPCLKAFHRLNGDSQKRERFFMSNSVRGFVGFLEENP